MEENLIQIHGRIMRNVDGSVKNVMDVKKIIFGILLHGVVKMENIQQVLWMIQRLRVMKLQSHEETKTISTNFNEKKATGKMQNAKFLFTTLDM